MTPLTVMSVQKVRLEATPFYFLKMTKRGFKLETRAYSSCVLILKDVQVPKLMRQLFVKCS